MTAAIDSSFYTIATYSGNGNTRRIEITSKGLEVACRLAFNGKFKPLTGDAVRMLLECVNQTRFASHTKGFSSDVVNELTTPWEYANDGAVLYPEDHQPWECYDSAFFEFDNPKMLAGNWISSTYHAEIAASLITKEIHKLKSRIRAFHELPISVE
jgi:hypothetical protein